MRYECGTAFGDGWIFSFVFFFFWQMILAAILSFSAWLLRFGEPFPTAMVAKENVFAFKLSGLLARGRVVFFFFFFFLFTPITQTYLIPTTFAGRSTSLINMSGLCLGGCGFYGNPSLFGLCSRCFDVRQPAGALNSIFAIQPNSHPTSRPRPAPLTC